MLRKLIAFIGLLLLILFISLAANAQNVKLVTIDQLEKRLGNGKDTVYVINFWATWCAPCVAELPNFEKLQATYKLQPLKVILVSVDFKSKLESAVIPFVKRNKLPNVFLLNEKSQQNYIDRVSKDWSGALPATLIVNTKLNSRNFYEQAFTYPELEKTYQTLK